MALQTCSLHLLLCVLVVLVILPSFLFVQDSLNHCYCKLFSNKVCHPSLLASGVNWPKRLRPIPDTNILFVLFHFYVAELHASLKHTANFATMICGVLTVVSCSKQASIAFSAFSDPSLNQTITLVQSFVALGLHLSVVVLLFL